ncbi:hypothetical protein BGX27_002336 [Mortierella sp. AM989]|nr:hypothetical protein BGX27_002336 [Mortierella sp. AM989]
MDCNWCAVCSKHFHSEHQASLYCSEECREADALACCAFHDCDHPDGSKHHDHLKFCHHHRPAIRVPTLPLLKLNPNPSAEQQTHEQRQEDEWTRFLQHQYSIQYHSHSAHTSTLRSTSHGHSHATPDQTRIGQYDHRYTDFPVAQQPQSFLLSGSLPDISCQQQQQQQIAQKQMQMLQQKPAFHARQRHSLPQAAYRPVENTLTTFSLSNLSMSDTAKGPHNISSCEQPCIIRKNKVLPPPTLSHIFPATISNPASLSPTAAASSRRAGGGDKSTSSSSSSSPSSPVSPSISSASSSWSDEEGQDLLSHDWPKMDKFFFPDHCCRTSACINTPSSSRQNATNSNNNRKGGNKLKNNRKKSVSELPPPPMSSNSQRDPDGCISLSASIWGAGWRQVAPLPESFVKTVQRSNLCWAGCEREHRPHTRNQRGRRDSSGHGCNNNGRSSSDIGNYHNNNSNSNNISNGTNRTRPIKVQGHYKSMSDASSWATECSNRLPRSLQFID